LGLTPWRLVVIAILILLFRRLPILIILKPVMPAMKTYREAIFSGWFGPMGVGAVFLSTIAKEEMQVIYAGDPNPPVTIDLIAPVVLFIVLASTLVHGTTIPLFKIGKRIRTRTLSIASTGSGQVARLPKLQFGQQVTTRRGEDEQVDEQTEAMSQLKRNTLMNTIQQPHFASINMDEDEDDGLNEEDFLPDESDETEVGGSYDDSEGKSVAQQELPTTAGSEGKSVSQQELPTTANNNKHHIPLAATTESQSIRFLEPVNPRSGSGSTGGAAQNVERNEASVSSFRGWMYRNKNEQQHEAAADEDVGITTPSPAHHQSSGGSGGGGLRNLFRRHNHKESIDEHPETPPSVQITSLTDEDHEIALEKPTERKEQDHETTTDILRNIFASIHSPHPDAEHAAEPEIIDLGPEELSSRIEVWDEPHHVVIEDKRDAASRSVIDKSDPNWKYLVKDKITELQSNIHNERE
jgi:hypothetical protein